MRLFCHSPAAQSGIPTAPPVSLVPVWDARDPGTSATNGWNPPKPATPVAAFAPPVDDPNDYIEFKFDLDPSVLGSQQITRSMEVADPRLGGLARMWKTAPGFNSATTARADTLGAQNQSAIDAAWDTKKFASADFSNPATSNYRPSVGMFSLIPTGMQRGIPGSTLKLQPSQVNTELPDWLLLDLLAPSAESANYSDLSVMNSSAGKVNLNAAIYPTGGQFTPQQRWQPLQAVFENMGANATAGAGATAASMVVDNIVNHRLATGGVDFGAPGEYDYVGEVAEIAGVADTGATDWEKEQMIRYVASNLTTTSNVFSVWGVAQKIKKRPGNVQYGTFQVGDTITGERRFQAIVERYIWRGIDTVAGNGHVIGSSGLATYDKLSTGATQPGGIPPYAPAPTWEGTDGPDAPTYPVNVSSGTWNQNAPASYVPSAIDVATNPLGALMKYRVISFRYLNE